VGKVAHRNISESLEAGGWRSHVQLSMAASHLGSSKRYLISHLQRLTPHEPPLLDKVQLISLRRYVNEAQFNFNFNRLFSFPQLCLSHVHSLKIDKTLIRASLTNSGPSIKQGSVVLRKGGPCTCLRSRAVLRIGLSFLRSRGYRVMNGLLAVDAFILSYL
jgi:hypothetical protein